MEQYSTSQSYLSRVILILKNKYPDIEKNTLGIWIGMWEYKPGCKMEEREGSGLIVHSSLFIFTNIVNNFPNL